MSKFVVTDLKLNLGDLLKQSGGRGAMIGKKNAPTHLLVPISEDLIDFFVEHDPELIRECELRRQEGRAGHRRKLADVARDFGIDLNAPQPARIKRTNRAAKAPAPAKKTA